MVRQRRLRGAIAATIVLVTAGIIDGSGILLLGGVIPLVYVAATSLSRVPHSVAADLTVSRSIAPTPAPPGRPVTVSLTVTNDGDRTLSDVRVVDSVPRELAVLDRTPRAGTTLEAGATMTVEYVIVGRRGEYAFEPPQIRVRGLVSGAVTTVRPRVDGDDTFACRLDADAPPLEEIGRNRIGQLTTDRPGEGVAFHSSREYHPDDPASRINWRQYAKRGELSTVTYDKQVSATIVLAIDARSPNHVVSGPGRPTGVELAAYAATRALTDLLGHGHDVGVAIIGLEGDGPAGLFWLEPDSSREQRSRALDLFQLAADATTPDDIRDRHPGEPMTEAERYEASRAATQHRKLVDLTAGDTQIALFSPILDEGSVHAVETWRGVGLPTIVLSPDIVPENTTSGQHAQIRRRTRLARCQSLGARSFDWRRGTPLPLIIDHAFAADARRGGQPSTGTGGTPRHASSAGGDD